MTEVWNMPRAATHAARVEGVLAALKVARQCNLPIGFGVACALVGYGRDESHATVARSFARYARLTERTEADKLVATPAERLVTRLPLDAKLLARYVRLALAKEPTLVMAVTKVSADTKFSPGWVALCERTLRPRRALQLVAANDAKAA